MKEKMIFVVDDNCNILKTLSEILKTKGYFPIAIARGEEALVKMKVEAPSVALIDLKLTDMSGLDVMNRIKDYSPNTECIILSGIASHEYPVEAIKRGAFGYFLKPFNVEQLIDYIGRAFKRYEVRKHKAK